MADNEARMIRKMRHDLVAIVHFENDAHQIPRSISRQFRDSAASLIEVLELGISVFQPLVLLLLEIASFQFLCPTSLKIAVAISLLMMLGTVRCLTLLILRLWRRQSFLKLCHGALVLAPLVLNLFFQRLRFRGSSRDIVAVLFRRRIVRGCFSLIFVVSLIGVFVFGRLFLTRFGLVGLIGIFYRFAFRPALCGLRFLGHSEFCPVISASTRAGKAR